MMTVIYTCLHVKDACAVLVEKNQLLKVCLMCSIFGEKKSLEGSIPHPCQLLLLGDEIMSDSLPIILL